MKYIPVLLLIFCFVGCRQKAATEVTRIDSLPNHSNQYAQIDQSPLDMSYFPSDYPLQKMERKDSALPVARVIYSRPHKKGRKIFGSDPASLCQYGKEWRLGANEATELELFQNVSIDGKNIPRGKYILYCIPFADKWTVVLNANLYTWGLHMDSTKDILRVDVPVTSQQPPLEDFTMVFSQANYGADLLMAWDTVKVMLPIDFKR